MLKVGDLVTMSPPGFWWDREPRWKWHGVVVKTIAYPEKMSMHDVVVVFGYTVLVDLKNYQNASDIPLQIDSFFADRLVKISD